MNFRTLIRGASAAALLVASGFASGLTLAAGSSSTTTSISTQGGQSASSLSIDNAGVRVTGSTAGDSTVRGDSELLGKVVSALGNEPALQGASLEVKVDHGKVTLGGTAKDRAQAEQARRIAERIAGSGNVSSDIATKG